MITAETLETLESIAKAAPAGRWEVWTSNSWRRVMAQSPNSVRTVQVIVPCVHPHDNHPDLMFGPGVKEWLEGFTPEVALYLIAEVRRLQVHREGSGTPSARLNYMLGELNQRFPLAVDVFSSEPAEPKFIAAIDELIAEVRRLRERLEIDDRHGYDGIYCRDETIRLQDAEIARLKARAELMLDVVWYADGVVGMLRHSGYPGKAEALSSRIKAVFDKENA
jgi:hypothetical protein